MSIGLTLMDDLVDIYVLNGKLEDSESIAANLEMINDLELKVFATDPAQDYAKHVSIDQIAASLPEYDHVLPY